MPTFADTLRNLADDRADPAGVLREMTPADLIGVLEPAYPATELTGSDVVARGSVRRPGDVTGVLAMSRESAAELYRLGVPYVYAVEHGDTRDFAALAHCAGFVTSNPAQTAFAPVQAVSEDRPTLVGLGARETADPAPRSIVVEHDGTTYTLRSEETRRLEPVQAGSAPVAEGEWVSLNGNDGLLVRGRLAPALSAVARFHEIVEEIVDQAVACGHVDDPVAALERLESCPGYPERAGELAELAADPLVRGFERLKQLALTTPLSTWATAHTPGGVARARMFTGRITDEAPYLRPGTPSVGLLRDERMWQTDSERELLQLVFLGPDVLGPAAHAHVEARYLAEHGERMFQVLRACRDSFAIARTLCMPNVKIFPADFDVEQFAGRHALDPDAVRAVIKDPVEEREVYHGYRGMRVFSRRPDIAELWLRAVLGAARRAHETGNPVRLRLLLATITLPAEAERFLELLDVVAPDVLGDELDTVLHGVSIMVETAGAYVTIEEFLTVAGERARIDGGMIGSNDLTAALLNLNREDAAKTIIPGYVREGLLPHSPFEHLEPKVVAPAILSVLRHSRSDPRSAPDQLWGLGGELAGDWETVQWLATHAEPLGMSYVTTAPRNMLTSVFAAAQAVLRASGELPVPEPRSAAATAAAQD